jgi:hypothetical protein
LQGHICDYKFYGRHSRKFKVGLAAYSSSKGAVILSELLAEGYKSVAFPLMFWHGFRANRNAGRSFSGYQAPISANEMANYIYDFTLNGNKYFNGKVLQVSFNKSIILNYFDRNAC